MFVYIWRTHDNVPFYVGCTNSIRRTNPKNSQKRNWLCTNKLNELGRDRVQVEIKFVNSIAEGRELEKNLIAQFGRIQTGTGPLTNLMTGGGGVDPMPEALKQKRREAFLSVDNPIRAPEAVAKRNAAIKLRMQDPAVRAAMRGPRNIAKKLETRAKLKALWNSPEYQEKMRISRTGITRTLSEETREALATRVKNNPAMKSWKERNGIDSAFEEKRITAMRASIPKRTATNADPTRRAKRIAALVATLTSPEYRAKQLVFMTPEYRAKLSAAKKAYWAKKRAEKLDASI